MEPSSQYPVVCFGEVLWDILPSGAVPGGAPMNVAYHLKKLGTSAALITKIGADDYGQKLVTNLEANDVVTEYVDVDYTYPTGLVYANLNDHNEVVYDIVHPAAWDYIEWKNEYAALVQQASFFVYGSLTSRSSVSRDTLVQLLANAKTRVLDINLRPPHFHRSQVEFLLQQADILKMNIAELELITGWFSEFKKTEDRIRLIQDQFGIATIIVTMGGDGALVSRNNTIYRHPGFQVSVVDTIGSGDAFLAGFLHQLLKGAAMEEALSFASAVGALIATKSGACPDYDPTAIDALLSSDKTSKAKNQIIH